MINKKYLLIILGTLTLLIFFVLISRIESSKDVKKGIISEQRSGYIKCDTATTTDDYENEYDEAKCVIKEIKSISIIFPFMVSIILK